MIHKVYKKHHFLFHALLALACVCCAYKFVEIQVISGKYESTGSEYWNRHSYTDIHSGATLDLNVESNTAIMEFNVKTARFDVNDTTHNYLLGGIAYIKDGDELIVDTGDFVARTTEITFHDEKVTIEWNTKLDKNY